MKDDKGVGRYGGSSSADRVRQVAVPQAARALTTLGHIDYEDAFLVQTSSAQERTPQQWVQATLLDAPITVRLRLVAGWSAIGLKLGRGRCGRSVLGWQVRRGTPEFVLLGADSRIGMAGELLFKAEGHALLFATFVQHDNLIARATWAAVEPTHVHVVRALLEKASHRLQSDRSAPAAAVIDRAAKLGTKKH